MRATGPMLGWGVALLAVAAGCAEPSPGVAACRGARLPPVTAPDPAASAPAGARA
ncbi:MAG: hypothetical protein HY744_06310 [Deltaproteobacteria bacterium]|nr:hypothetical protein [Deltaproteobacteria bacterium]